MDQIIHFRVLLDYDEDIFRDIEISSDSNFQELHNIIQAAFGFDNSEMASFYVSNDEWDKGQEITLMEVMGPSENGTPVWTMHDTALSKIVFEKGQKLIYVYDFMLMWCFYIDVIRIKPLDAKVILPRITQSFGDAPDQHKKSTDFSFDSEEVVLLDDAEEEPMDEFDEMFNLLGDDEAVQDERDH